MLIQCSRGTIINVLGDNVVDAYMWLPTGKEMWDALEAKYGVSDAGSELYVVEQFYDYRMVDGHSIVGKRACEFWMCATG
jgi:hypothetical protein